MKEDNFASRVAKKVNKDFVAKEQAEYEKEPYYSHPTFCIKNLSEYIQLVTTISSVNKDDLPGETVIFRGISDSEYDMSSSNVSPLSLNNENPFFFFLFLLLSFGF